MTKDGSNARKRAARDLAAAEQIPYTEALRRAGDGPRPAGSTVSIGVSITRGRARVGTPVPTLASHRTLVGHTGAATGVAFHPDGRTLASGGDVTARLWDVGTGENTAVLDAEGHVSCVGFHPGGEVLAVGHGLGASAGEVSVWTIASGEIVTLRGFSGAVESVAFSPDGHTLAVGTQGSSARIGRYERVVHLWDVRTGRAAELARQTDSYGADVAFSPDGRLLAGCGDLDGTATLWDLATGAAAILTGHGAGVNAVAFSRDGRTLATGSVDGTVRLWDVATGRTTAVLEPREHYVLCVAFSPDGRTVATGNLAGRLWDVGTGRVVAVLRDHTDLVHAVAFSPDGRTLATASSDRTVRLWHPA